MNKIATHKMKILIAVFALVSLGLFQNCGKSQHDDSGTEGTLGDKSTFEKTEEIDAVEGESVDLEVPELGYLAFLNEGECLWTYTNPKGETKEVKNPKRIFKLGKVSKKQSGTYQLICSNSQKQHTYKFEVTVKDPIAPSDAIGLYEGSFIVGGKLVPYASIDKVTYLVAIADCKKNSTANATKGIKCLWQKTLIFSKAEPIVKNTLMIFTIKNGVETKNSEVKNLLEADARAKCKEFIVKTSSLGVRCLWGTVDVGSQLDPNRKANLKVMITRKKNAAEESYKIVGSLTLRQSIEFCQSESAKERRKISTLGMRCVWEGIEVFNLAAK